MIGYVPNYRVWDSKKKRMLYPPMRKFNYYVKRDKRYAVMMSSHKYDVSTSHPRELYEMDVVNVIHSDKDSPRNIENALIVWDATTSCFGYQKGGFIWDFYPYDIVHFVENVETKSNKGCN